ncbi:MAG: aldo/keto reductase [Clostridia bacterium]|nr:aldo/keto reductase [Clostridia bacterium]
MKEFFKGVSKKLGFGCMRLPMKGDDVDIEETCRMVDTFIERGFNYFDTAHGYLNGKSELAVRDCLTSRYPRESYVLADKLSWNYFNSTEEIRPFFESQLKACGVDYFDFYLMHAQDAKKYERYTRLKAYETAYKFKEEGLIKHFGLSFHDKADVLDKILSEHPEVEFVQIQFNYIDYDDPSVESRKCYEVCVKHGKPVIVMEPIKGGSLINLPDDAQAVFDELGGQSNASYAVRFAAGFDNVFMVLSGMSSAANMDDNTSYMQNFKPLDEKERAAVKKVVEILNSRDIIPCTTCRYCMEVCPKQIPIPNVFSLLNSKRQFNNWNTSYYYEVRTRDGKKASDCIKCGRCEKICPQHLEIRKLLEDVAAEFEK